MCTPRKVWKREYADCNEIVILTLCCLVFATAKAQIDTQFSQYWALPAITSGSCGKFRQTQHTHLHPATMDRYAGSPSNLFRDRRHAFQILETEPRSRTGRHFRNRRAYTPICFRSAIAFKIKLWKGVLSLGIQLGMLDERFDGTQCSAYPRAITIKPPTTESPLPSCKACRSICLSGHGTPIRGSMREFRSHTSTSHRSPLKTNTKHTSADPIILSPGAIFPLKTRYMKCSPP